MRVRQLKNHLRRNPAPNKLDLIQNQVRHNNQKGLKRSEEMIHVLAVLEKNTNTAMVDEDYSC